MKFRLMNGNSDRARDASYGDVESLFFLSRSSTALSICHQHSCIFGFHTSLNILISAISLSTCAKMGKIPYVSRRQLAHAVSAFVRLPGSMHDAVDNMQYDNGKPL